MGHQGRPKPVAGLHVRLRDRTAQPRPGVLAQDADQEIDRPDTAEGG